jgi:hypothetical protein
MRVYRIFFWIFILASFAVPVSAAVSGDLTEVFLRIMTKGLKEASAASPEDISLLKKTPAFIEAAKVLGKNATEPERRRASTLLDRVLWAEYAKHGVSHATATTCDACLPTAFADDINGRAIDLIKRHDDLLIAVSTQQGSVLRLVDQEGKSIPSQSEYRKALDEMMVLFAPGISIAKGEKDPAKFLKAFSQKLKENGSVEVEYDAKGNALTAIFKYGPAKAKIANVDVAKIMARAQYLLYAGGLAVLGYKATDKNAAAKEPQSKEKLERARLEILRMLSPAEREALLQAADSEYLVVKVKKLQAAGKS